MPTNRSIIYIKNDKDENIQLKTASENVVKEVSLNLGSHTHPEWEAYHPEVITYRIYANGNSSNYFSNGFDGVVYNSETGIVSGGSLEGNLYVWSVYIDLWLGENGSRSKYILGTGEGYTTSYNYINMQKLIDAGETGLPMTEILNVDNSEEENYPNLGAQEGTLWVSAVLVNETTLKILSKTHYYKWYNFTFTIRPNITTDVITDLITTKLDNTEEVTDLAPLITKIGGSLENILTPDKTKILTFSAPENDELEFISFYAATSIENYNNYNSLNTSNEDIINNDTTVDLYFPEKPYCAEIIFKIEDDLLLVNFFKNNYHERTYTGFTIDEICNPEGIALYYENHDFYTESSTYEESEFRLYGEYIENESEGLYNLQLTVKEQKKTRGITLKPSLDPIISLAPIQDDIDNAVKDSIIKVEGKYSNQDINYYTHISYNILNKSRVSFYDDEGYIDNSRTTLSEAETNTNDAPQIYYLDSNAIPNDAINVVITIADNASNGMSTSKISLDEDYNPGDLIPLHFVEFTS